MKSDILKYKSFFFDFDGVIADSLDIKTKAFGELFKQYGRDISIKVMEYHLNNGGVSRYVKFKYYYKKFLNREIDQKIINKLDHDYSGLILEKVTKAPYVRGVITLLKFLSKTKKRCFVISGTPQKEIRYILKLKKIDRFFHDVAGSPRNKTRNLEIMLKRHINPLEAVFFGDAKSDYEAARKHKVRFVGIVNHKSGELREINGIEKIKDFIHEYI
jgi:HAD superfamily hydrolase (TIGR01549 family)